jgi:alkanesulfonate monooxygenase SsuD/methylene tetrahydromethanopterin reductase-like flavin-dependent oxidoreductase (luciferase family)
MMRFGVVLPGGTAREQLDQAVLAERSGWDGVFVWEAAYGVDAWSLLAAMAVATSRVRLGTMLTPSPWRRPWKLAGQVATVDQLSGGRAVLAVGVGATGTGLPLTGEVTDVRQRAAMMDEGIDLMRSLWSGGPDFQGQHYSYASNGSEVAEAARPVQARVPIWVVGLWPRPKSMRRVLKCDGVIPNGVETPADLRAMRSWLAERGAPADLDVITEGETPADDPVAGQAAVALWEGAGATWWMETRWSGAGQIGERIAAGPPRRPS